MADRPMRADARRNRERIVAATIACFTERGAGTGMNDIAVRAGVGVASLYRSFGSRSRLVEAVYRDTLDSLVDNANRLADRADPSEALETWLTSYVASYRAKQAMLHDLSAIFAADPELLISSREQARRALQTLLVAAQNNGTARAELTAADLLSLAHGAVVGRLEDTSRDKVLIGLIIRGLRPA